MLEKLAYRFCSLNTLLQEVSDCNLTTSDLFNMLNMPAWNYIYNGDFQYFFFFSLDLL